MLSSLLLQDCSESSPKDGLLISDDYDHHVAPPSQGPIRLFFTLSGFSSHITMHCQTRDVNINRMDNTLAHLQDQVFHIKFVELKSLLSAEC